MKVQQVIGKILEASGNKKFPVTCDQLVNGDPNAEVTKVVTTFMATVEVIQKAMARGADMIVTHEPTYFTGSDSLDWLTTDSVYLKKKALLGSKNIAIWRYHDHMHAAHTDQIYDGLLKELGWEKYIDNSWPMPHCFEIPEMGMTRLVNFFKQKLEMNTVRIIGSPDMKVKRVGMLVGGYGLGLGHEEMPMQLMERQHLDVIVCGEITEWTSCAYVRDAHQLGLNKGMIIIGHERTEEPGMKYMAEWLPGLIGLPVEFISAKEPFVYL